MSDFRNTVKNSWVITIYEDCIDIIGFENRALGSNLFTALDKAQQIFGDDYSIIVRNVSANDLSHPCEDDYDLETADFCIKRNNDMYPIGEIEFWPQDYEPMSMVDAMITFVVNGGEVKIKDDDEDVDMYDSNFSPEDVDEDF
jgi:hypothetical protein